MAPSQLYSSCPVDKSRAQIRLIHLQPCLPSLSETDIVCTLHLANLEDETTRYQALSYEWKPEGSFFEFSAVSKYCMTLNGDQVPIRENLYRALWHIRSETEIIKLWVDALCIDQDNEKERNHQVNYMGAIYSRAESVLAWLGPSDQPRIRRRILAGSDVSKAAGLLALYQRQNVFPRDTSNEACRSVLYLCRRTYWSRLWIIQELVLAQRIVLVCGDMRIPWDSLEKFFARPPIGEELRGLGASIDPLRSNRQTARVEMYDLLDTVPAKILQQRVKAHQATQPTEVATLFELFHTYRRASCTDVRDKVFGLRSLSRDCCQASLRVDYSQSPAKVWRSVVKHYLVSHQEILISKGTSYQAAFYKMARDLFFVMDGGSEMVLDFAAWHELEEFSDFFNDAKTKRVGKGQQEDFKPAKDNKEMVAGLALGLDQYSFKFDDQINRFHLKRSADDFEILLYDFTGGKQEGTFSSSGCFYVARSPGFQVGGSIRKVNDNEFLVLRGRDTNLEIVGKAARRYPLFVPKKQQMDTSMILELNMQSVERLCRLNFESCGLRSILASQDVDSIETQQIGSEKSLE